MRLPSNSTHGAAVLAAHRIATRWPSRGTTAAPLVPLPGVGARSSPGAGVRGRATGGNHDHSASCDLPCGHRRHGNHLLRTLQLNIDQVLLSQNRAQHARSHVSGLTMRVCPLSSLPNPAIGRRFAYLLRLRLGRHLVRHLLRLRLDRVHAVDRLRLDRLEPAATRCAARRVESILLANE